MMLRLPTLVGTLLLAVSVDVAQAQGQTDNLTPDWYWHNRYHAWLGMSAYGDYNSTCPIDTFTVETNTNFPNTTYPPFEVYSTFGPTPSGCRGYTAIVPEMNKALIVFAGDYQIEKNLPTDVVGWDYFGVNSSACYNCTANRLAAQAYMECKTETNNWAAIKEPYEGQGLVFSITGHGFGGMVSLIAAADLNHQRYAYYHHTHGAPRTFNGRGAKWYNYYFNGEAGERGVSANDMFTEIIPASEDYAHAGTVFKYTGTQRLNETVICWDGVTEGPIVDSPACMPAPESNITSDQDHYFYMTNVGQCGGERYIRRNLTIIDSYLASVQNQTVPALPSTFSVPPAPSTTSSSSIIASTEVPTAVGGAAVVPAASAASGAAGAATTRAAGAAVGSTISKQQLSVLVVVSLVAALAC